MLGLNFLSSKDSDEQLKLDSVHRKILYAADLSELAKNTALTHGEISLHTRKASIKLLTKLKKNKIRTSKNYKKLYRTVELPATPSEQWLIDNLYLIQETFDQVSLNVTDKMLKRLPTLKKDNSVTRIYDILQSLILNTGFSVDINKVKNFIKAYQQVTHLTIAELWSVQSILQAILLENITQLLEKVLVYQKNVPKNMEKLVVSCVVSLHDINKANWRAFAEQLSVVENILRKDPLKAYSRMDFQTRDRYRHIIEEMYYSTGVNQEMVANWTVRQAEEDKRHLLSSRPTNHVGYYLIGEGKGELDDAFAYKQKTNEILSKTLNKHSFPVYFGLIILFSFLVEGAFLNFFYQIGIFRGSLQFLLWVLLAPASLQIGTTLTNILILKLYHPFPLPKMDPSLGVLKSNRTFVVIPTLISEDVKNHTALIESLEINYLANPDDNIFFALILAFPETQDFGGELTPAEQMSLDDMLDKIKALNTKYKRSDDIFHIFLRKRVWNESQNCYLEWERKRGKMLEFGKLLRGSQDTTFVLKTADSGFLSTFKYILTLDDDMRLPVRGARSLIATISHPLNTPIVDPKTLRVTEGYSVIQPRLATYVTDKNNPIVRELFSGATGWDSYSPVVSSVYQDLFSEGFYQGKGIYDVDVFNTLLQGRFENNTLLSHDHIEGFYCRTGYASDIQVFEGAPHTYLSYISRLERWWRGDWQRIGWLLSKVKDSRGRWQKNPLRVRHKWKLFEDLCFSLVTPTVFIVLVASWFSPAVGQNHILAGFASLLLLNLNNILYFGQFVFSKKNIKLWRYNFANLSQKTYELLFHFFFNAVLLCHHCVIIVLAVIKALYRVYISRRKTLEWRIFSQVNKSSLNTLSGMFETMLPTILLTSGIFYLLVSLVGRIPFVASVFMLFWMIAPIFAYYISIEPKPETALINVPIHDQTFLRGVARRTWRYFDDFVSSDSSWLPPDRFQSSAATPLSPMTSITDIGFYLLSVFSAQDMGYISALEVNVKIRNTLDTLSRLQRTNGHFYNWYDCSNLKPLSPFYVSTVDSGNLAAFLLTVSQGMKNLPSLPVIPTSFYDGFCDGINLLLLDFEKLDVQKSDQILKKHIDGLNQIFEMCGRIGDGNLVSTYKELTEVKKGVDVLLRDPFLAMSNSDEIDFNEIRYWYRNLFNQISQQLFELLYFCPWLTEENPPLALEKLGSEVTFTRLLSEYQITPDQISSLQKAKNSLEDFISSCNATAETAEKMFKEMNFLFLYDEKRNLFHIGYNGLKKKFDKSYYDLLAGEARTASLLAIAKNDVPIEHWVTLGRPLTSFKGSLALVSWAGAMFEYLFPLVIMPRYDNTLLAETYKTVVNSHVEFGRSKKTLWGMSESSYGVKDKDGLYHYKLHGVSWLGLRSTKEIENVISPYSTALALEIDSMLATANMKEISKLAHSEYGLYEAIDYSSKKENTGDYVVKTLLTHHQGAILNQISNLFSHNRLKDRFKSSPYVEASMYLLQENIPGNPRLTTAIGKVIKRSSAEKQDVEEHQSPIKIADRFKKTQLHTYSVLSNGNLSTVINNRGGGYTKFQNMTITRWKNDPTLDNFGSFFYISDSKTKQTWSPTFLPTFQKPDKYQAEYATNFVALEQSSLGVDSTVTAAIMPNDDVEIRKLSLVNTQKKKRVLDIYTYQEILLNDLLADLSHPAFDRMMLESDVDNQTGCLLFSRTVKGAGKIFLAVNLVDDKLLESNIRITTFTTSRREFIGRNMTNMMPSAIETQQNLGNGRNFNVDKVSAFKTTCEIAPQSQANLFLVSAVGKTKEEVLELAKKYSEKEKIVTEFGAALRYNFGRFVKPEDAALADKLLTCMLTRRKNVLWKVQSQPKFLQAYGDPVLLVKASPGYSHKAYHQLLRIVYYLLERNIAFNVVILTVDEDQYSQKVLNSIQGEINEFENLHGVKSMLKSRVNLQKVGEIGLKELKEYSNFAFASLNLNGSSIDKQISSELLKI